jgi:hypothetical protein
MQAMRLRAVQRPSRLEALLESLVMSQNWVSGGERCVTGRSDLSSAVRKLGTWPQ